MSSLNRPEPESQHCKDEEKGDCLYTPAHLLHYVRSWSLCLQIQSYGCVFEIPTTKRTQYVQSQRKAASPGPGCPLYPRGH